MGQKLIVKQEYRQAAIGLHYAAGQVIVVGEELARWLQADAPQSFEVYVEPAPKAVDAPPVDKMMRKPKAKK